MRYDAIISLWALFPLLFSHGGLATPSEKRDDPAKPAVGRAELEGAMSSWPAHLKYFPEEQSTSQEIRKREAVAGIIRDGIKPVAVKALRPDENDMFWPEYWGFDIKLDVTPLTNLRTEFDEDESRQGGNSSAVVAYRPPFKVHGEQLPPHDGSRAARKALAILQKRDFDCPAGTSACTSVNQPNYCCGVGETCSLITDTGLGPVGCCPAGVSCAGDITQCNTAAGQIPCPQNLGGACCVEGFGCYDVGCVRVDTATLTQTLIPGPPPTTSSRAVVTTTSTSPVVITTISTSTSFTTTDAGETTPVVVVPPVTVPPEATRQTGLPCNGLASFTACPSEIGGCCLSGRICAVGSLCPLPGETITPLPPVRGTGTSEAISATSTLATAPVGDTCPTGFYACSAFYPGGPCCRIGRDCVTSYCASTASGTIVSDGKTVVVPLVPAATTTAAENCAQGWSQCPAEVGGLCCPSGWACGTASCSSAAASETRLADKAQPVGGTERITGWSLGWMCLVVGGVMAVS